jgi:hypothetical protein
MNAHLRHDHGTLLESLLSGKLPRSLPWHDVVELISHIGEVLTHGGDEFTFVVEGQRFNVKRPHHDELDMQETSRLRKFLRESRSAGSPPAPGASQSIVVVDHDQAHIYRNVQSGDSETEETLKPYDPFGFHRHLIHRKEAHYIGDRVPEENSYYEEIAAKLGHEGAIILIGHAKGKSSAMEFLVEFLKNHHPDLSKRITATEVLDLSALTEPEIEAIVRKRLSGS